VWSRGGSLGEGCLRICLEVWSRGGSLGEGVSGRESRGGCLGVGVSGRGVAGQGWAAFCKKKGPVGKTGTGKDGRGRRPKKGAANGTRIASNERAPEPSSCGPGMESFNPSSASTLSDADRNAHAVAVRRHYGPPHPLPRPASPPRTWRSTFTRLDLSGNLALSAPKCTFHRSESPLANHLISWWNSTGEGRSPF
jgi:hypothetical protein